MSDFISKVKNGMAEGESIFAVIVKTDMNRHTGDCYFSKVFNTQDIKSLNKDSIDNALNCLDEIRDLLLRRKFSIEEESLAKLKQMSDIINKLGKKYGF